MVVLRPGRVVAPDTTPLPVKVREAVFGDPAAVTLTIALDCYTHSIVAFRLTLVSDTLVDVAMLLRDVMMPLPLREGRGTDMEWPYPGVPKSEIYVVRSDRRDRRTVFFQEEAAPEKWNVLRWSGLPSEGEVPAFSDKTAEALRAEVRQRNLAPRSDAELLPVLPELPGSVIPVEKRSTQVTKRELTARSRQTAQARTIGTERPKTAAELSMSRRCTTTVSMLSGPPGRTHPALGADRELPEHGPPLVRPARGAVGRLTSGAADAGAQPVERSAGPRLSV